MFNFLRLYFYLNIVLTKTNYQGRPLRLLNTYSLEEIDNKITEGKNHIWKFDEQKDWVIFKLDEPHIDLKPPFLEPSIRVDNKVHIFSFPSIVVEQENSTDEEESCTISNNEFEGFVTPASITSLQHNKMFLSTTSMEGCSGGSVVLDSNGSVVGVVLGQYEGEGKSSFQMMAIMIATLPDRESASRETSPVAKRVKVDEQKNLIGQC